MKLFESALSAKPLRYTRGLLGDAVNELKRNVDILKTNIPINLKEGKTQQAALEQRIKKSCKLAINILKKHDTN